MTEILKKIFFFYLDGFKNMKVGKKLWLIIGIKFLIFFVVLKLFFFPDILNTQFSNDEERANFVIHNLTQER
jgi:hypothetical protein